MFDKLGRRLGLGLLALLLVLAAVRLGGEDSPAAFLSSCSAPASAAVLSQRRRRYTISVRLRKPKRVLRPWELKSCSPSSKPTPAVP